MHSDVWVQDILIGQAKLTGEHTIKYSLPGRVDVGGSVSAKDIIIATGSVPFVPPGMACSSLPSIMNLMLWLRLGVARA